MTELVKFEILKAMVAICVTELRVEVDDGLLAEVAWLECASSVSSICLQWLASVFEVLKEWGWGVEAAAGGQALEVGVKGLERIGGFCALL